MQNIDSFGYHTVVLVCYWDCLACIACELSRHEEILIEIVAFGGGYLILQENFPTKKSSQHQSMVLCVILQVWLVYYKINKLVKINRLYLEKYNRFIVCFEIIITEFYFTENNFYFYSASVTSRLYAS